MLVVIDANVFVSASIQRGASHRRRGDVECVEELERHMCSVAAPLGPSGLTPTLSIGATGSLRVFTPELRVAIAHELVGRLGRNGTESAGMSASPQGAADAQRS